MKSLAPSLAPTLPAAPDNTALLIVEHDFLTNHVGVRRVILYYWQELLDAGYAVTMATPRHGSLYPAEPVSLQTILDAARGGSANDTPCWTSSENIYCAPAPHRSGAASLITWRERRILLEDFSTTIITNPWLCAKGLPKRRYTAGIVYDMIPNLLACNALTFGVPVNAYAFAQEHDIGYRFFLENAEHICCISESTRRDFLSFYHVKDDRRVETVIPFKLNPGARIKARLLSGSTRSRVLLVNVLDPRKNIAGVVASLELAAKTVAFDVTIVGRERMSLGNVMSALSTLREAGIHVEWYSGASDEYLSSLYADADLLIFPSFYEGLGLPILEAQMHGVPTISSDQSSCAEVNVNRALQVDPGDTKALARTIVSALEDPENYLAGRKLRDALARLLKGHTSLTFTGGLVTAH